MSKAKEIAACLLEGGVAVVPTDTVYGLAVSPQFEASVDKLFELKQRSRNKNLPIMVANMEQLQPLGVDVNLAVQKLVDSPFVPGALTFVLGFIEQPLVKWLEGREEIAVRIPNDAQLLEVLQITGPLLVTSANRNGLPTPDNVAEILEQLAGKPDLAIEGGNIQLIPSTIVNCRKNPPQIERVGAISKEKLTSWLT